MEGMPLRAGMPSCRFSASMPLPLTLPRDTAIIHVDKWSGGLTLPERLPQ